MRRFLVKAAGISTILFCSTSVMADQLATFKGGSLTSEEYKAAIEALGPQKEMLKSNEELRKQYLYHLIDLKLLADEAQASKIEDSAEYKAIMAATQREVLAKLYVDKYLKEQTSTDKLKKYFNDNKKDFSTKEVQASHILFNKEDKATAEKVLAEARKKGSDFSALLAKYAKDPSGARGGDLGYFAQGTVVPAFEEAAFSTPKGQVHPKLVETEFGWHILKVTDVRGGDKVKFEDKKDEVEQAVRSQASEKLVQQLRDQANIKISEESLKALQL